MIRDALHDAFSSLWRQKLRTALTVGGVTVAIATLVALLSFAAGMRHSITDQLERFSLLLTLTVTPSPDDSSAVIDSAAMAWMQGLEGVRQVHPQRPFSVTVYHDGDTLSREAQALPPGAEGSLLFKTLLAGEMIADSSHDRAMVTLGLVDWDEEVEADSLLGDTLVLRTTRSLADSGFAAVRDAAMQGRVIQPADLMRFLPNARTERPDSVLSHALAAAASAFFDGYTSRVQEVRDTVVIAGVVDSDEGWGERLRPVILTPRAAREIEPRGISSNPLDMMNALQSGDLFAPVDDQLPDQYSRLTVELEQNSASSAVADSLRARGFEVASFQEFYEEFRRGFLIFTAGLTLLGSIALFVAALGIVNTMVTSILERRREIGVLKALGAEDRDIRLIFLVESAAIGLLGSVFGILLGWGGAEIGALILFQAIDESPGEMDLIHLSPEVVLIGLAFGLVVSVIAGLYPANRAARLDPVKALRED